MSRWRANGAALALLVLAIFLRVAWIGDYPAFHSDEGFWASGARNLVRFGDTFLDNRLHPYLSPGTFAALVGWFGALPPSLVTARLFSAAAGIATCVLVWDLARTLLPHRTWLPVLFFGVSGLTVLLDRTLLLEAHQTFWLVLATALLFAVGPSRASLWSLDDPPSPAHVEGPVPRRALLFAGVAFGMALLVKSNSFYAVPAFAIAVFPAAAGLPAGATARERLAKIGSRLTPVALFFGAAAVVAAAGYAAAFAHDPERFRAAFRYEVEATHFLLNLPDPLLFHVGRFGFRPIAATLCLLTLARSDPFLVLLGFVGAARVLRRPHVASRAERFFTVWALSGVVFAVVQINVTYRYFGSIAPALVFLAAFVAEDLFAVLPEPAASRPAAPDSAPATPSEAGAASATSVSAESATSVSSTGTLPVSTLALEGDPDGVFGPSFRIFAFAGVFLGFHLARLSVGLQEAPNRDYWRTVTFLTEHAPREANVLAAPYLGLSLPQKSLDFFRVLRPYGNEDNPLPIGPEVERRHIGILVRDAEWRHFETPDMASFVRTRCTPLARFGEYEVLSVRPPPPEHLATPHH